MKKGKMTFLAVALMTFLSQAQAAFLIEPHIGYNLSGSGDSTYAGVKEEHDYNSAQYGLRLGGQYLGFMAGLDYTLSSPEYETKSAGVTYKDKLDTKELGFFVGYNLPILLRVWGAYYFNAKAEDQENSGYQTAGTEYSGSTKELGVGFTALPFLSVNLMYRNPVFDEVKSGGVTTKLSGDAEFSSHEFVIGVSLPLTL